MSYQIVVELHLDQEPEARDGVEQLLSMPRFSLHWQSPDRKEIWLRVDCEQENVVADTRWVCNSLIDAGWLSFRLSHST